MPPATISVDLDPVDAHLAGYGHAAPHDRRSYERALPRLLEVFARHKVRATFFLLARDAGAAAPAYRSIVAAGHEVASHSFDHPPHLPSLPAHLLQRQLRVSRDILEETVGKPVTGFRAPDWAIEATTIEALGSAGYAYDASLMPSPVLTLGRAVLALRARRPGELIRLRLPASTRRRPFVWRVAGGGLVEFPVTVTPRFRMPIYHTLRYSLGSERFEKILDGVVARNESLSYPLHAIDALGLDEDGVDRRMAGHPGMALPLDQKLGLLDETLACIAARFDPRPFSARIEAATAEG